jgi:hypothetical protein
MPELKTLEFIIISQLPLEYDGIIKKSEKLCWSIKLYLIISLIKILINKIQTPHHTGNEEENFTIRLMRGSQKCS